MKKQLSIILALSIIYGCNTPISNNLNNKVSSVISNKIVNNEKSEIHGLVMFPKTMEEEKKLFKTKSLILKSNRKKNKKDKQRFSIKAGINDISENSTVSFINIDSNATTEENRYKVIGSALASPDGVFDITFGASNFNPELNKVYILEASKRIGTSGANIMTIRTFIRWNGSSWDSITSDSLIINEYTTAISIIQGFNSSTITKEDTFNKISFSNNVFTPTNIGPVGVEKIYKVANYVLLSIYQSKDPYTVIKFNNTDYYLDQNDSFERFLRTGKCEGCKFSQSDLQSFDFKNKDLAYADFSGLNLSNIDFSNSILYKANFSGIYSEQTTKLTDTDITGINLSYSNLRNIDFSNQVLSNANLSYSQVYYNSFENSELIGINFSNSNMTSPNFTNSSFENVKFNNVTLDNLNLSNLEFLDSDFTGTHFKGGEYSGIDFIGSNFTGSTLSGTYYNCLFDSSSFKNTNLNNAKFSYSDFGVSSFEGVSLIGTRFPESNLDKVDFSNQNLSGLGMSLKGAILRGQDFSEKDLSNLNLSFTDLSNVNLEGSNISNGIFENVTYLDTKMPNGSLLTYNPLSKLVYRKNNEIFVLNQLTGELLQLTNNTLEDSNPIITKDTIKVVYVEKNTSGKRDIYIINSNGTDNVKLTDDTRDNYEPVLSDDGTKIIYTSKDGAFSNIYVMNLDGTNKLNLTNQTDKINKEASTFSNKIVYVSNDEIYQRDLDGNNLLKLTSLEDYGVCSLPKFSPNGTKIGILSDTNRDGKNINNKSHLWVINTDNTNLSLDGVRLTRNTGNVNDFNTLNGIDNYLWSFENSILYSSYTDINVRTLYRAYVNYPLVNNRVTYGNIDSELLGVMKNKLDKLTANRNSGVIYYLYEGKVISYDIDYGVIQELTGN